MFIIIMASTILLLQFNNKHLFFVLWQSIPRNIRRPVTLLLDVGIRGQNREVVFHTARISCVCVALLLMAGNTR